MSADFNIIVNKNSFSVYCSIPSKKRVLEDFSKQFNTYQYLYDHKVKRKVRKLDKVYKAGNKYNLEYIFNIRFVKDFMWHLKIYNIPKESIEIVTNDDFIQNDLDIKFNYDKYKLREYQEEVKGQVKDFTKSFSFLIDHQTGKGKGIMSISSICEINKAVAILILPRYIDKWIKELKETTDITDDDIVVIQGSKDLIRYMDLALSKEYKAKIIIFSSRTYSNYIRDYEKCEDLDDFFYPIMPTDLAETFGLGVLLIDEVHREYNVMFKASLYFNVDLVLGMSATLISMDRNKEKLYQALFPDEVRLSNIDIDRYIRLFEIEYVIDNHKRINCVTNMGYNHIAFEQSIMRHNQQKKNYTEMLKHFVREGYLNRRKKGDKLLIFFASIDLCTAMTYVMRSLCPNLTVSRYVEDDNFDSLFNSDIIVTTVLSSGEAFDIPGLITVIQTISTKSPVSNIQALGRLRNLEGKEMRYYQLFSRSIQKHLEYSKFRLSLLKPRVKEVILDEYRQTI